MTVRSKTLAGPTLITGNNVDTTVYTVPSGATAVLRSIRLVNTSSGASATVKLRTTSSSGTIFKQVAIPLASEHRDDTWTCFGPGTDIRARVVENIGNVVTITISGAELDGVAP